MKTGLVLEGGAMRGLFTAGVLDVLMRESLRVDGIVGVSAGAAFGCNVKSHQSGRVLRYSQLMARDWRYCSWRSLFTTGDLFGAEYAYHYVPTQVDIFDCGTYAADPMEYYVVATDVETGQAVYKRLDTVDYNALEWIRASASMPLCSRIVQLDGYQLLDGGVADSIPLQYFEEQGYGRNIVILTQPLGYRKNANRLMPLMRLALRRFPRMVQALATRHLMYNAELDYVAQAEHEQRALVIRPPRALPIGHLCHDPEQMRRVYDIGVETAEQNLDAIRLFLEPHCRVLVGFMKDGNMANIQQRRVYYIPACNGFGEPVSTAITSSVDYVLLHTEHNDICWMFRVEGLPYNITGNEVREMNFLTRGNPDNKYIAFRLSDQQVPADLLKSLACDIPDRSFRPYFITCRC